MFPQQGRLTRSSAQFVEGSDRFGRFRYMPAQRFQTVTTVQEGSGARSNRMRRSFSFRRCAGGWGLAVPKGSAGFRLRKVPDLLAIAGKSSQQAARQFRFGRSVRASSAIV